MPVFSTHPDYDNQEPDWRLIRDVIAGERQLKEAGESYIERLSGQDREEYQKYLDRGSFFPATKRTRQGLSGSIFMKEPVVVLGKKEGDSRAEVYDRFKADADLTGSSLDTYVRCVTNEVLESGRGGTLVDWSEEEGRPYLTKYQAEDILNWRSERVNGRLIPVLIVLREFAERSLSDVAETDSEDVDEFDTSRVEQIRVLRLDGGVYRVELWQEVRVDENDVATKEEKRRREKDEKKWEKIADFVPGRRGESLTEIPFVAHGAENDSIEIGEIPLLDLGRKNLDHYRLSTQLRHGLFFTALPTAVISDGGLDQTAQMRIGSSVAWVLSTEGKAAFLEFSGAGLGSIRETIEDCRKEMAVTGARMLETQQRDVESAETHEMRQSGETSVLVDIAKALSEGLTRVLQWVVWWTGGVNDLVDADETIASFSLNTDFIARKMSAEDAVKMVSLWQSEAISKETLFFNLKQGEIIPPEIDFEEEQKRIEDGEDELMGLKKFETNPTADDDFDRQQASADADFERGQAAADAQAKRDAAANRGKE